MSPDRKFFMVDPSRAPEERVFYGQAVNPMSSQHSLGSPVKAPPARALRSAATMGSAVAGAQPPKPEIRRVVLDSVAVGQRKLVDTVAVAPMAKLATGMTPAAKINLQVRPSVRPNLPSFDPPGEKESPPNADDSTDVSFSAEVEVCLNQRARSVKADAKKLEPLIAEKLGFDPKNLSDDESEKVQALAKQVESQIKEEAASYKDQSDLLVVKGANGGALIDIQITEDIDGNLSANAGMTHVSTCPGGCLLGPPDADVGPIQE